MALSRQPGWPSLTQSYLLTYLLTYLPTYLPTYLLTYLLTYLPGGPISLLLSEHISAGQVLMRELNATTGESAPAWYYVVQYSQRGHSPLVRVRVGVSVGASQARAARQHGLVMDAPACA